MNLWWKHPRTWSVLALVATATVVLVLVIFMIIQGREKSDQWASILFGLIGIITLAAGPLASGSLRVSYRRPPPLALRHGPRFVRGRRWAARGV